MHNQKISGMWCAMYVMENTRVHRGTVARRPAAAAPRAVTAWPLTGHRALHCGTAAGCRLTVPVRPVTVHGHGGSAHWHRHV